MKLELFVELIIPDNTAHTAFYALKKKWCKELIKLKRYDYYLLEADSDEGLFDKISKVDILVNANKHKALKTVPLEKDQAMVIIKDIDNAGKGILYTLTHRLGFSEIKSVTKGVAWVLTVDGNKKTFAKKATEQLFMNENYQDAEYRF